MTAHDTFSSGQTVVRRGFRGPHLSWAQAARVIRDDGPGLVLWVPEGADFGCRVDATGQPVRAATDVEAYGQAQWSVSTWAGSSTLQLHPPAAAHSVWWFFTGRTFTGWYVNLESPFVRRAGGIDMVDHHLDIVVRPDRTWRWKDEEDFVACTGRDGYWTDEQAAEIRAEGDRAVAAIEAGRFPFDGTWRDFAPDPQWATPRLPAIVD